MRLDHLLSNGAKETKLRQSFQSLKKTEVKASNGERGGV